MSEEDLLIITSLKQKAIKYEDYVIAGQLRDAEKHLRERLEKIK